MGSPTPAPSEHQPKIVQKLLLRTLLLVIALGAILVGIRSYLDAKKDPGGNVTSDTVGWLAAIEYKDNGQEVVAVKPDLSIHRTQGWAEGNTDRDLTWGPGGNFLYFVSDRKDQTFHVYRWSPSGTEAVPRTIGKRGRSALSFPTAPGPGNQNILMTSGGLVMEFSPVEQQQFQVLPPVGREIPVGEGDEAGAQSQFSAIYGSIGTSFKSARWCGNDDHIAAIMGRDEGDILIVQDMRLKDGQYPPPVRVAAGDRIEMDVNPKTGHVVYSVANFQWPSQPPEQFIKDGKVSRPFWHYVAIWSPEKPVQLPVVAQDNNTVAFSTIAVHPDGEEFVVTAGPYADGSVQNKVLISFPAREGAGREGKQVVVGEVFEPTWNAAGTLLAYAKRDEDGKRTIFTANRDGSSERNITGGKGDFGFPKFSPQVAK